MSTSRGDVNEGVFPEWLDAWVECCGRLMDLGAVVYWRMGEWAICCGGGCTALLH
jgi:hypothetical protein